MYDFIFTYFIYMIHIMYNILYILKLVISWHSSNHLNPIYIELFPIVTSGKYIITQEENNMCTSCFRNSIKSWLIFIGTFKFVYLLFENSPKAVSMCPSIPHPSFSLSPILCPVQLVLSACTCMQCIWWSMNNYQKPHPASNQLSRSALSSQWAPSSSMLECWLALSCVGSTGSCW